MSSWQLLAQSLFNITLLGSALLWWHILSDPRKCLSELDGFARPTIRVAPAVVMLACLCWPIVPVVLAQTVVSFGGGQLQLVQASFIGNCLIWVALNFALRRLASNDSQARMGDYVNPPPQQSGVGLWADRRDLRLGVLGFLATCLPVFAVVLFTQHLRTDESQHSFLKLVTETPDIIVIASVTLAAVIGAPLAEELVFRVILQGALEDRVNSSTAVVSIAVLFSAIHADSLARIPDALGLFPLAMVLGLIYQRTHNYAAIVIVHMLFNATNLLMAVLTNAE